MNDHKTILQELDNLFSLSEKIKGISFVLWESLSLGDVPDNTLRAQAAYALLELTETLSEDIHTSLHSLDKTV